MKNVIQTRTLLVVFLFVLSSLVSSCQSYMKTRFERDLKQIRSVSVFPFQLADEGAKQGAGPSNRIVDNASEVMTTHLINRLKDKGRFIVVAKPPLSEQNMHDIKSGVYDWKEKTDTYLLGRVFYYRDRKGGDYSVSDPSRVAFDFCVIRISDGVTVYQCEYDETQKPLSDNVLTLNMFIKRKGHWIKAEEMAKGAIDDAVDDLSKRSR